MPQTLPQELQEKVNTFKELVPEKDFSSHQKQFLIQLKNEFKNENIVIHEDNLMFKLGNYVVSFDETEKASAYLDTYHHKDNGWEMFQTARSQIEEKGLKYAISSQTDHKILKVIEYQEKNPGCSQKMQLKQHLRIQSLEEKLILMLK